MFYVLFLFEDFDQTTKRLLTYAWIIGTQLVRGFLLFLLARRDEIMKCYFKPWPNGVANRGLCVQRPVTHDQMTRLIFLCQFLASFSFLTKCNSSHLETLLRFCMGILKYSKFDLERTTTRSTIIVYISLDFLLWQMLPFAAILHTPHQIVLFL